MTVTSSLLGGEAGGPPSGGWMLMSDSVGWFRNPAITKGGW